jgi:hypothetical protein
MDKATATEYAERLSSLRRDILEDRGSPGAEEIDREDYTRRVGDLQRQIDELPDITSQDLVVRLRGNSKIIDVWLRTDSNLVPWLHLTIESTEYTGGVTARWKLPMPQSDFLTPGETIASEHVSSKTAEEGYPISGGVLSLIEESVAVATTEVERYLRSKD